MAPTPANIQPSAQPTEKPARSTAWSTGAVVIAAIFGLIFIALIVALAIFWFRKRTARHELPAEHRPKSYHPFRPQQPDKMGLLEGAAPSPENSKSSMFSRHRSSSSVSLYVDTDAHDKRGSIDTANLIPLRVTPTEGVRAPTISTGSNGSGVSQSSSTFSGRTGASLGVDSIEYFGSDWGSRSTRPRSTSASSTRYYSNSSPKSSTPPQSSMPPQIPKLVHTPLD